MGEQLASLVLTLASRATIPTADEYGILRAMEEEDARIQPGR
jgi:hypothetical protein